MAGFFRSLMGGLQEGGGGGGGGGAGGGAPALDSSFVGNVVELGKKLWFALCVVRETSDCHQFFRCVLASL